MFRSAGLVSELVLILAFFCASGIEEGIDGLDTLKWRYDLVLEIYWRSEECMDSTILNLECAGPEYYLRMDFQME